MSLLVAPVSLGVDLHGAGQVGGRLQALLPDHGFHLRSLWTSRGCRQQDRRHVDARVLVDCTTPRYHGPQAQAWVHQLCQVLEEGSDVVTCNKAPLVTAWSRLEQAAKDAGRRILASGTVGGGTPVLPWIHRLAASHDLTRIEATLSGTLTAVVGAVARGASLADAVRAAQEAGLAEPDPTLDLDGTDAYAKAVILHNTLFPDERPLDLGDHRPLELEEGRVRALVDEGLVPNVVATVTAGRIELGLRGAAPDAAFASGVDVNLRLQSADGACFRLVGPGAGPDVTARNVLADLHTIRTAWAG